MNRKELRINSDFILMAYERESKCTHFSSILQVIEFAIV